MGGRNDKLGGAENPASEATESKHGYEGTPHEPPRTEVASGPGYDPPRKLVREEAREQINFQRDIKTLSLCGERVSAPGSDRDDQKAQETQAGPPQSSVR